MGQNMLVPMRQRPTMHALPATPSNSSRRFAVLLWGLTTLFVIRVFCQAIQRWWPQHWLPEFEKFQGSNVPYQVLLGAQILIILLMVHFSLQVQRRTFSPTHRAAKVLTWFGSIYMLGSVLRIGVGLLVPTAPPWFSTWIPATLHLVLAGYVLTLSLHPSNRLDT
jgi:hypothetical protein